MESYKTLLEAETPPPVATEPPRPTPGRVAELADIFGLNNMTQDIDDIDLDDSPYDVNREFSSWTSSRVSRRGTEIIAFWQVRP